MGSWFPFLRSTYTMATDLDKEDAAAVLRRACGDGVLSLDEFGDRVGAVWAAESVGDVRRVTASLPPPVPVVGAPERLVAAVFGAQKRSGHWRVPSRLRVVALLGRCRIDLRSAVLSVDALRDGVLEIEALAVAGSIRIIVPEGVDVVMGGRSLLGLRAIRAGRPNGRPHAALTMVRVTGNVALGAVKVRGIRF